MERIFKLFEPASLAEITPMKDALQIAGDFGSNKIKVCDKILDIVMLRQQVKCADVCAVIGPNWSGDRLRLAAKGSHRPACRRARSGRALQGLGLFS
jgi:hypothetical protein